jgi:cytochrome c oxidase subunit 3
MNRAEKDMDITYHPESQQPKRRFYVHPYKFNLWLAIGSMIMFFTGLTSAYLVKSADTNVWESVALPSLFTVSTVLILLSSICMVLALRAFKANRVRQYQMLLLVTLLLGIGFMVSQVLAWKQLLIDGIELKNSIAGAYLYVISGAHLLHALGGVIALTVFTVIAFRRYRGPVDTLELNIAPDRRVGIEVMATYWHFVDILWLYLFIFFITQS